MDGFDGASEDVSRIQVGELASLLNVKRALLDVSKVLAMTNGFASSNIYRRQNAAGVRVMEMSEDDGERLLALLAVLDRCVSGAVSEYLDAR